MRVSEYFKLGVTQPVLDFVDVDIANDLRVFIDPRALRMLPSEWGAESVSLIQNFFETVLAAIREGRDDDAQRLLVVLKEPNETHLGLSRGKSRGRALGPGLAEHVWKALRQSMAVKSGLLQDLEDGILMVDGVRDDIVSDIATNVIREPLIRYTQAACAQYGIPLTPDVDSGPTWNPLTRSWESAFVSLPMADGDKLLLVPKIVVRRRMHYDVSEYYGHYLLQHLRNRELEANTELVHLLKNGKRRVYRKDLEKKYGTGKAAIVRETLNAPDLLEAYRRDKANTTQPPLTHERLAHAQSSPTPDWHALLGQVVDITAGKEGADAYEKAIERLLSALFYPSLANPILQHQIHQGRKRIDITYTNAAQGGFFWWASQNYSAGHIFVECKNYGQEVGNPELDQLSGRFSPSRGQVGLLLVRSFENKGLFLQRCRDTAGDQRGFILALDDGDLATLIDERESQGSMAAFGLLLERFQTLVM